MAHEAREKLKELGYDPALARHVGQSSEEFFQRLDQRHDDHREAFVEIETNRVLAFAVTQHVMNLEAEEHPEDADKKLSETIDGFAWPFCSIREAANSL